MNGASGGDGATSCLPACVLTLVGGERQPSLHKKRTLLLYWWPFSYFAVRGEGTSVHLLAFLFASCGRSNPFVVCSFFRKIFAYLCQIHLVHHHLTDFAPPYVAWWCF